jgi:hypothetical protein
MSLLLTAYSIIGWTWYIVSQGSDSIWCIHICTSFVLLNTTSNQESRSTKTTSGTGLTLPAPLESKQNYNCAPIYSASMYLQDTCTYVMRCMYAFYHQKGQWRHPGHYQRHDSDDPDVDTFGLHMKAEQKKRKYIYLGVLRFSDNIYCGRTGRCTLIEMEIQIPQASISMQMSTELEYITRGGHEVPEYAAASFWCIFDFYSNGNCRLGRAFSGTCYLLRVRKNPLSEALGCGAFAKVPWNGQ